MSATNKGPRLTRIFGWDEDIKLTYRLKENRNEFDSHCVIESSCRLAPGTTAAAAAGIGSEKIAEG